MVIKEGLDVASRHPENQDPAKQSAIEQARYVLVAAGVKDPSPKVETILQTPGTVPLAAESLSRSNDVLDKAIAELKTNPFSPEAATNYWRAKLQTDGKRIGLDILVPDCNWTEEEIRRPMIDTKGNEVPSMMVYVPQELTGKEGLVKLGQMYPEMNNWSVQEGTIVQDDSNAEFKSGWLKVEATDDAPNLNTTQGDLEKHAKEQGYLGQRENVYILASQASKDLTGHYLDEELRMSRLLGSRYGSHVVHAGFNSGGGLSIRWVLSPQDHVSLVGGRFEEVKKA